MATKKKVEEVILIRPVVMKDFLVTIKGTSPLITHAWSAKAKKQEKVKTAIINFFISSSSYLIISLMSMATESFNCTITIGLMESADSDSMASRLTVTGPE